MGGILRDKDGRGTSPGPFGTAIRPGHAGEGEVLGPRFGINTGLS